MTDKNKISEEQRLKRYLDGEMSHEEQHEFERDHADDPFVDDAMEGLKHFGNRKSVDHTVQSLNNTLRQQLHKRRPRRRNKASQPSWVYFSIILILLMIVIAFVVIRYYR